MLLVPAPAMADFRLFTMADPPPSPTPNPDAPSQVPNWIKGNVLGAGPFGTVYVAINKDNGKFLAVKSVECLYGRTPQKVVDSIDNEIRILRSLDSPHIVKFLGSDYTFIGSNGSRGLVKNLLMECVKGGSLHSLRNNFRSNFDEDLVRIYTRGILQGLQYLHAQGIVHCDIKGKNILVGGEGSSVIKIADFGSAIQLAAVPDLGISSPAKIKHFGGTPLWMAPEVFRQIDQTTASDIWSLGCTVLEIMTGNPPWISQSICLMQALYKIGYTEETPTFPPGISKLATNFLLSCLQRDPHSRPSASELLSHPFIQQSINGSDGVVINGGGNGNGYGCSLPVLETSSPKSFLNFRANGYNWASVNPLQHHQQGGYVQSEESHTNPPQQASGANEIPHAVDETGCQQADPVSHICNTTEPLPPSPPVVNQSGADGNATSAQANPHNDSGGEEVAWIVVRASGSSMYTPQAPSSARRGQLPVPVKKPCQVDLGCLSFIRKRRREDTSNSL